MRAVTFLLTDIEGSTAAWEADADAMAVALARHDELVEQVVTSRGGRLIKTRGEGDATFSVFERPSAAAAAAMELQDAIIHEQWGLREPMRIRIALHTGEVELRDGDYFGRAVNRAARLRSLAWVARSCARARPPSSSLTHCPTTLCSPTWDCASCATSPARSMFSSSDWKPLRTCLNRRQAMRPDGAARPPLGADRHRAVRRARARARSGLCPPGRPRLAVVRVRP